MSDFVKRKTSGLFDANEPKDDVVARWESRSGKHWVEVYKDKWGYGYSAPGAGGDLGTSSEDEAIAKIQERVDRGDFQYDSNVTPMKRVTVRKKGYERASDPDVVALVFERGSNEVYDRTFNMETATSMVLEGYAAVAIADDGPYSKDRINDSLEADMTAYEDLWGVERWRPDLSSVSSRKTAQGGYRLEFGSDRDAYWVALNIAPDGGSEFSSKDAAVSALVEFFDSGQGGDLGGPIRVVPASTAKYQRYQPGRTDSKVVGEGGWMSDGSWGLKLSKKDSEQPGNSQNGLAESDLDHVEVDDEDAKKTMFPWEDTGQAEEVKHSRKLTWIDMKRKANFDGGALARLVGEALPYLKVSWQNLGGNVQGLVIENPDGFSEDLFVSTVSGSVGIGNDNGEYFEEFPGLDFVEADMRDIVDAVVTVAERKFATRVRRDVTAVWNDGVTAVTLDPDRDPEEEEGGEYMAPGRVEVDVRVDDDEKEARRKNADAANNPPDPEDVEVGDEDDRPQWPVDEYGEVGDGASDAADVSGSTPSEGGPDQPAIKTPEKGDLPAQARRKQAGSRVGEADCAICGDGIYITESGSVEDVKWHHYSDTRDDDHDPVPDPSTIVEAKKTATTRHTLADPNVWKKLEALPALYATDGTKGDRPAVRLFNPYGNGSWIIWEYDPATKEGFGWADMGYGEMGYISVAELASQPFMGQPGLGIERDTSVDTMLEGFRASGTTPPSTVMSRKQSGWREVFQPGNSVQALVPDALGNDYGIGDVGQVVEINPPYVTVQFGDEVAELHATDLAPWDEPIMGSKQAAGEKWGFDAVTGEDWGHGEVASSEYVYNSPQEALQAGRDALRQAGADESESGVYVYREGEDDFGYSWSGWVPDTLYGVHSGIPNIQASRKQAAPEQPGESNWISEDAWPHGGGTNRPEVEDPDDYFDAEWVQRPEESESLQALAEAEDEDLFL